MPFAHHPALALFAALALLPGCRGWESEDPPIHLIRNMDTQEKGKAYRRDSSGLFADGRTQRPPVEGTVALGQLDEDDALERGVAPDGQPVQHFPLVVDEALVRRGEGRYIVYCAPCHGVRLDGHGSVAKRGLAIPPPDFMSERLKGLRHGSLYAAIRDGVNNDNMPSYASQIPTRDRWAIVAYIRRKQGVDGPPAEAPRPASQSPETQR